MNVTKLIKIQSYFKTDTYFLSFSCRKREDQGRRKNTADRIRMCQRRQHARSLQHRAALSEAEAVYDSTVASAPSVVTSFASVCASFFANSTDSDDFGRCSFCLAPPDHHDGAASSRRNCCFGDCVKSSITHRVLFTV
jgi:hypothetical protein